MDASNVVSTLVQKLHDTGLADRSGRLLYSGIGTLIPGKVYMLGYNPGGNPDVENDSIQAHLDQLTKKPTDWNEYVDGVWRPGGRLCPPGGAPMQRRVLHLSKNIGLSIRTVCASNVIFVRSQGIQSLENRRRLAEQCWPVHQFILSCIRPQAVISIGGGEVFNFLIGHGKLLSSPRQFPAGHASRKCLAAPVEFGNIVTNVVSVPSLARYAIDHHPDVIRWVQIALADAGIPQIIA